MSIRLSKEQAASRQLDTAIDLLFAGADVVSVQTLAAAASNVFADLLRDHNQKAWEDEIVECFPDNEEEARRVLRSAQNFFKHADRDPKAVIDFDEVTNDETIIVATLEYGNLLMLEEGEQKKLTTPMSVFQMWYFAKAPELLLLSPEGMGDKFVQASQELFPDLKKYPRFRQLALGMEVLQARLAKRQQP